MINFSFKKNIINLYFEVIQFQPGILPRDFCQRDRESTASLNPQNNSVKESCTKYFFFINMLHSSSVWWKSAF